MPQPLTTWKETPSQTAGPYVHIGLTPSVAGLEGPFPDPGKEIAGPNATGERIAIEGVVHDRHGAPMRDCVVELWQADAAGIYNSPDDPRFADRDPGVFGWGRAAADLQTGLYRFETVKPGPVPTPLPGGRTAIMAPHALLWIVARGINVGLLTRVYFADEGEANAADPILGRLEHQDRRATLIAPREETGDGAPPVYRFDVRLGGPHETVFFDA